MPRSIFPTSIDSSQSLYSVIPLALDISNTNKYMKYLDTPYGDCQFFSPQECPGNDFTFMKKRYSILHNSINKNIHNTPFTTLLVGPSYACKQVVNEFDVWAKTDTNSIALPSADKIPAPHHISSNNMQCWLPIQHPNVWAQATFTNVTVTTAFPNALQQELQHIFQFPITVNHHSPISSNEHNELAAWLVAIYALIAARNLYRNVICHSHSWSHHLQFFTDVFKKQDVIPKIWKPLVTMPYLLSETRKPKSNEVIDYAINTSKFNIKLESYKHKKIINSRIIGMSYIKTPIISALDYKTIIQQNDLSLTLTSDNNKTLIISPFNPSGRMKKSMIQIVSNKLEIPVSNIRFEIKKAVSSVNILSYYYPLVCSLLLRACKKIQAKKNRKSSKATTEHSHTSTLSEFKSLLNYNIFVCCITEFDISRYSKEIKLSQLTLSLDAGYISNHQLAHSEIEDMLFNTLFSLCGQHHKVTENFTLNINFLNHNNENFASSFTSVIDSAISHAIINTIGKNLLFSRFPTRKLHEK